MAVEFLPYIKSQSTTNEC